MDKHIFSPKHRQAGISIIEIMITLVLGLFIIGGVLYTFLSTRTTYISNDAIARIQEDGRMAMERLAREIRQAGFMGCSNSLDITPRIIADPDKDGNTAEHVTFGAGDGIQVYNNGVGFGRVTRHPSERSGIRRQGFAKSRRLGIDRAAVIHCCAIP